jgi:hypothetical protein
MKNLMEDLWSQINKTPDGKGIILTDVDVEYLWHCGFIDTRQVPFAQWASFFAPFLTEVKGVYVLNRANFKLIEDFRYKGPVREPFDFQKINEGFYTDQGLDELFELGVGPSAEAGKDEVSGFIAALKKEFRSKDNLIHMNAACKKKIGVWMDAHPSPLRRLELIMEAKSEGKTLDPKLFQFKTSGVDAVNAMQANVFSTRPSTLAVSKKEALSKVTQTKAKKGSDVATDKGTPLHKLRRSPRGTRG